MNTEHRKAIIMLVIMAVIVCAITLILLVLNYINDGGKSWELGLGMAGKHTELIQTSGKTTSYGYSSTAMTT